MSQHGWYYCPGCHNKVAAQDDTPVVSVKTVRTGVEAPRHPPCANCLAQPPAPAAMQAEINELRALVARQGRARPAEPRS